MRETVLNEGITSELVITNIDRSDSALYQCITSNAYGKDETSIQVIVQGIEYRIKLLEMRTDKKRIDVEVEQWNCF